MLNRLLNRATLQSGESIGSDFDFQTETSEPVEEVTPSAFTTPSNQNPGNSSKGINPPVKTGRSLLEIIQENNQQIKKKNEENPFSFGLKKTKVTPVEKNKQDTFLKNFQVDYQELIQVPNLEEEKINEKPVSPSKPNKLMLNRGLLGINPASLSKPFKAPGQVSPDKSMHTNSQDPRMNNSQMTTRPMNFQSLQISDDPIPPQQTQSKSLNQIEDELENALLEKDHGQKERDDESQNILVPVNPNTGSQSNQKFYILILDAMECVVCYARDKTILASKCGHLACEDCWNNWLKIKLECPMCKKKVRQKQLIKLHL